MRLGVPLIVAFALFCSACGYGFRSRSNPWADKGVTKVYVQTLTNNTLSAGVEVPFTSALVKEFARGGRLKLVSNEADADAVIEGSVDSFGSTANSTTTVSALAPADPQAQGLTDAVIAVEYVVNASITVRLVKRHGGRLWEQQFSRPKVYPAGNRFGLQGSTASLINSSQEAIALDEIAEFIASDVHDTMLEAF